MNKRAFVILFLFALILRLFVFDFIFARSGPSGLYLVDATHYMTLAKNLVEGHGFSLDAGPPYAPDAYRVPFYPLYLAVFYKLFGAFWPAVFFQALLNSLIPAMVAWLAWKVSGMVRVAAVAGFLIAAEPHFIFYQAGVATEGIFTFLLALFAVTAVRYIEHPSARRAFWVGLLFAVLSITRPYFIYALPVPFAFFFLGAARRDWKRTLVFFMCFLIPSMLILFPWMLRNERDFGVFILSTSGWYNTYTRLAAMVYAGATHQPFGVVFNKFITQLRDDGVTLHGTDEELYDPRVAPELQKRALAIFETYPLQTLLLQPISIQAIFTQDNLLAILNEQGLLPLPKRPPIPLSMALLKGNPLRTLREFVPYISGVYLLSFVMRAVWLFVFCCAVAGAYILLRTKNRLQKTAALVFAALVLFFVVVTLPDAASIDARLRTAFEPIYFIFVAAGLVLFAKWVRKKSISY